MRSRGADICRNGRPPHSRTLRLATPGGSLDPGETAVCGPLAPGGGLERERGKERADEEGGLGFEPLPFPLEFSKWVCAGWKYARSWS